MAIPAYSLYAAYPACTFQGYTMLMASPKGAMPPSSIAPAHFINIKHSFPMGSHFPVLVITT
jgi:hypothetical protein